MKPALILTTLGVVGMTLIPGILDGQRRFRWGTDSELVELASRLENFPKQIGEWRCASDTLIDKSANSQLQPITYINRVYVNDASQMQASVFILLGPTGPTAVHTPDICFSSRDFSILQKRQIVSVDPANLSPSKCYETRFQSRDASGTYLKSWYAWTIDGNWQAPDNPRYFFSGSRFLFKIQVVVHYPDVESMEDDKIMDQFLAEIEKSLRSKVF